MHRSGETPDTPSVVQIRSASERDARAIASVHVRAWQWAYRGLMPDGLLEGLSVDRRETAHRTRIAGDTDGRTWVAERDGTVVGFCVSGPSRDADASVGIGEISALYIEHDVAGMGVGRALLNHAVDDLRRRSFGAATLWVLDTNARARRFYERQGWRADGACQDGAHGEVTLRQVRYRREL